jgi:AcrR family transcriptional regulator
MEKAAMQTRSKRRPRDPDATRETILAAARTLLAKDGPEGISLSEVAHLAGVNRGTAYQHFETREKLIQATVDWVSDRLFRAAFGDPATIGERRVEEVDIAAMTDRLSDFAMDNPELCRVWLLQVLASPDPAADPFWKEYLSSLERFAASDMAVPGIDAEVLSVINLAGVFLWPVWARAHAEDQAGRTGLARRFARETLRLSMYGSLRAEAYPGIAERLRRQGQDDSHAGAITD